MQTVRIKGHTATVDRGPKSVKVSFVDGPLVGQFVRFTGKKMEKNRRPLVRLAKNKLS